MFSVVHVGNIIHRCGGGGSTFNTAAVDGKTYSPAQRQTRMKNLSAHGALQKAPPPNPPRATWQIVHRAVNHRVNRVSRCRGASAVSWSAAGRWRCRRTTAAFATTYVHLRTPGVGHRLALVLPPLLPPTSTSARSCRAPRTESKRHADDEHDGDEQRWRTSCRRGGRTARRRRRRTPG